MVSCTATYMGHEATTSWNVCIYAKVNTRLSTADPVHIQAFNLVITVSADALAPKPSTNTALTIRLEIIFFTDFLGCWCFRTPFHWPHIIQDDHRDHTISWWRHQMETFSALLAICAGSSPVPGEFPAQRPATRSFDVFFDLRLNKRLRKQPWGWWFETLSLPLRRHCNVPQHFRSYGTCIGMHRTCSGKSSHVDCSMWPPASPAMARF